MRPRQSLFTHIYATFCDAFRGLQTTWKEERNFRIGIFFACVVLITFALFGFSYTDITLAIIAITLVLSAEVINTTFEDTLNKIEPNFDPVIGKIKDVSAGIVVINVLGAFIIGVTLLAHHFFF